MNTEDIPQRFPSPWQPEQDRLRLAVFGKSQEELGELVTIIGRCIIQGVEGKHPETGKPNKQAIAEEIGDVLSKIQNLINVLDLDSIAIASRADKKFRFLAGWLQTLAADHDGWYHTDRYNIPREVKDGDVTVDLWVQPDSALDDISRGTIYREMKYVPTDLADKAHAAAFTRNWIDQWGKPIDGLRRVTHWRYATNEDAGITTPVLGG